MVRTNSILKTMGGAVAALSFAAAAHADHGQLVLFDGENFNGEGRAITGPVDTLVNIGFNDRVASLDFTGDRAE